MKKLSIRSKTSSVTSKPRLHSTLQSRAFSQKTKLKNFSKLSQFSGKSTSVSHIIIPLGLSSVYCCSNIGAIRPSLTLTFKSQQLRTAYSSKVLEHFEKNVNPATQKQAVRSMDKNDPNVGTGWVGAPACGDMMKLQIKVNPTTKKIEDACFKTFGCGSAIASSSVVSEMVKEKTLDEALQIKNSIIAEHLSLPPVKLHCSMLAEDAIKAAIQDYKKKQTVE